MSNLYIFTGLALIILGAILFCLAVFMIARYEKKLIQNKRLYKSFMKAKENEKSNFNNSHNIVK
tara:strand:- start:258 stop:449 length:192 start_codon:yes stop_codon:yes gene_type:complete